MKRRLAELKGHVLNLRNLRLSVLVVLAALGMMAINTESVAGQATRTWVSGVGDDANPCSRTAPCKTFGGTISKTAAGGVINCLDPGGFGAVTITKSLTIDCAQVGGGILAAGVTGVIVNALTTDVVTLRGINIEGVNTGLVGVNVLNVGSMIIEDCRIHGFNSGNGAGIRMIGGGAGTVQSLFVTDSSIRNNGINVATGGGVIIGNPGGAPSAGTVRASLNNVELDRNNIGLRVAGVSDVSIANSRINGNISFNVLTATTAGAASVLSINNSDLSESVGGTGVRSDGAGALTRMGNSTVFSNSTGLLAANGGILVSLGGNQIQGNTAGNGAFNVAAIPPQ